MEQRDFGRTGLKVSALGFGCGAVGGLLVRGDPDEQTKAVRRALDAGITYFDTAPVYGNGQSEQNLGRALAALNAWDKVVVGTKVRLEPDDLRDPAAAIRRSLEQSLRRLNHESVDLLQLHNRITATSSGERGGVRKNEVLGGIADGFDRVVADGLARHVGFTGLGEKDPLLEVTRSGRFESVQSYFNVLNPSAGFAGMASGSDDFGGLIDVAATSGVGVIVIRPFAAGALSAQPDRHPNAGDPGSPLAGGAAYQGDLERARTLEPIVAELGFDSPLELGLRFVQAKQGVSTVIVGYSNLDHLESAIRWTERGPLPDDLVDRVVRRA